MRNTYRRSILSALVLAPLATSAEPQAGERLSFVACPIVRDTRSVPCWLSEHDGELYYLTIQSDVSAAVQPPMLGHQVIVEGVVSDAPRICGGVVLSPVRLSVMPELDANCRTMLPADDRYTVDFNPRPPGPSAGRLAFAPDPAAPPRAPAARAQGRQAIEIYFDFDKGVSFRHPADLLAILERAREIGATRGSVTGVRGAHLLTDGTLLEESPSIGQRRAEEVARLLAGAGLTVPLSVDWQDGKPDADGIDDWSSRRVTVVLEP
jgi:hypothetical protein